MMGPRVLASLQGVPYSALKLDNVSDRALGRMLGNGFSANVLERVLLRCFIAVGMCSFPVYDKWGDQLVSPVAIPRGYEIAPCKIKDIVKL